MVLSRSEKRLGVLKVKLCLEFSSQSEPFNPVNKLISIFSFSNRSRSRSPSDSGKPHLPDELKQHLEFQLVDTEGMSEDQLREIPYTVVKTNAAKAVRVRLSSSGKPKVHSMRRVKK